MRKLLKFIDLKSDVADYDKVHESITDGVSFRGTNLWILVFAIFIACIGLNTNSTAVIIGAMLISPLMGPINGMGYAIATYDFLLLRRAFKNFVFAVLSSLVASTIYFSLTPISTAHSELLARTSPTIYDVLIALFGGLSGILAISSRHKGNVIPGVAIATALMPPLCTAGFGLARGEWPYFFGAFYLFTINTVFIGISSVLFSQILDLPIRTIIEPKQKRRVNQWITVIIGITIIPSLYFGYLLIEKERFTSRASQLISRIGAIDGSYLLKDKIEPTTRSINLLYGGSEITGISKSEIFQRARELDLDSSQVKIEQAFSIDDVNQDITQMDVSIRAELNRLHAELQNVNHVRDSVAAASVLNTKLFEELAVLYPELNSVMVTDGDGLRKKSGAASIERTKVKLVVLEMKTPIRASDRRKLNDWLTVRLNTKDSVQILYR